MTLQAIFFLLPEKPKSQLLVQTFSYIEKSNLSIFRVNNKFHYFLWFVSSSFHSTPVLPELNTPTAVIALICTLVFRVPLFFYFKSFLSNGVKPCYLYLLIHISHSRGQKHSLNFWQYLSVHIIFVHSLQLISVSTATLNRYQILSIYAPVDHPSFGSCRN